MENPKRTIGLTDRHGVLLYKQLTRHMMDNACRVWRSAALSHVGKLQVLKSNLLRIATNALGTLLTGKFKRIWLFWSLPTTSDI